MSTKDTVPFDSGKTPAGGAGPSADLPNTAGVGPSELPGMGGRMIGTAKPGAPVGSFAPDAKVQSDADAKAKAEADKPKGEEREPSTYGTGPGNAELNDAIVEEIRTVFDPEIPVNIYDMGMIYEVRSDTEGSAYVKMTLTSPSCPVAGTLPGEVEDKVRGVEGVSEAKIELVWDPPWDMEMMSEEARLELNL